VLLVDLLLPPDQELLVNQNQPSPVNPVDLLFQPDPVFPVVQVPLNQHPEVLADLYYHVAQKTP
jgi:hypothetical protein